MASHKCGLHFLPFQQIFQDKSYWIGDILQVKRRVVKCKKYGKKKKKVIIIYILLEINLKAHMHLGCLKIHNSLQGIY
jgi:hypothetical protein